MQVQDLFYASPLLSPPNYDWQTSLSWNHLKAKMGTISTWVVMQNMSSTKTSYGDSLCLCGLGEYLKSEACNCKNRKKKENHVTDRRHAKEFKSIKMPIHTNHFLFWPAILVATKTVRHLHSIPRQKIYYLFIILFFFNEGRLISSKENWAANTFSTILSTSQTFTKIGFTNS